MKLAAALVALLTTATPALATEWIDCADAGMNVSISLLTGTLDVLAVVGARLDVGDRHWVSSDAYAEGPIDPELLAVGQAFEDSQHILVDLMDEAMATKLAELRLFKAEEGEMFVYAGTLRVPGSGAWAVSCTGP